MIAAETGAATPPIDWRSLNLDEGGRSLIEASAGTGKTWTIVALYLRLLLQRQLSPRQIVVTTFTDAAAQELRERLRGKLQWAVTRPIAGGGALEDGSDGQWLRARWQTDVEARVRDLQRLQLALAEMDVAPVGTLHSLCRRVLADHPFACGVAFVLGDMVASELLLDEVAGDLWRRLQQAQPADDLVVLAAHAGEELTLQKLTMRLKICLAPGVTVPVKHEAEIDAVLEPAWAPRLRAIVADDAYFTASCPLRKYWRELAVLIEDHDKVPGVHAFKGLKAANELKGIAAKRKTDAGLLEAARFSVRCTEIFEYLRERPRRRFWRKLTGLARAEMHSRLAARHQMTYDSLIQSVSDALIRESTTGKDRPLADALFNAWPVALVDEFQDTDGQQYGILDAIYRCSDGNPRGRLVMIGDPKQAIYRFRGGDIHAYQRAAAAVDTNGRLTLDTNHRSSAELVEAFNQFYAVGGKALDADGESRIVYEDVCSTDRRAGEPYTVDGEMCNAPLVIHFRSDPPPSQPQRCAAALQLCANQIADMLQSGRHCFGGKPVQPCDISVLLPTGRNITDLRNLLASRGIPCVTSSRSSVFQTDLARDLQVVLYAVAHEDDLPALRGAAATRLWGDSFSELQQRADDVASWQPVARAFRRWHGMWRERGVQAVVDQLMAHMAPRYLQTLGGERALTDLRHLGELLQAQSESVAGIEELMAWFTTRREDAASAGGDAAEAAQLRIESDSARVRLLTLHASKGLEFPIVFLPLMWNHGEGRSTSMHVVSAADGTRNVGFSAEAKASELRDLQDERFRVLYVALTRAIYACHVFALDFARPADGRGGDPARRTARSALDVMLARMQPPLASETGLSAQLRAATPRIRWIEGWQPTAQHDFMDARTDTAIGEARIPPLMPSGPLEARHSFTTLMHGEKIEVLDPGASAGDESDTEIADLASDLTAEVGAPPVDDAATSTAPSLVSVAPHPDLLALAAVRGTDVGNAIHAIFEHRVIGVALSGQRDLIERCLDDAGVRRKGLTMSALIEVLARRLQSALDAPLGLPDQPSFRLADLPAIDLRAEMEFAFVLDHVAMTALQRACARHGEGDLVPHGSRVLSGLMNGKIDLLFQQGGRFHVLDYKGNYLGDTLADYQDTALHARMDQNRYRFQALIYTVAVDRYLRQRLGDAYRRDQHLGECVYLFVRAAGLAPGAGVWRHRFADALLTELGEVLNAHGAAREVA